LGGCEPKAVKDFREAWWKLLLLKANPEDVKAIEAKYLGVKMPGSHRSIPRSSQLISCHAKMGKDLGLLRESIMQ